MEQDNKKYEFKAVNLKQEIIIGIVWVILFLSFFIFMQYLYRDDKIVNVIINLKIIGIPFLLSFILSFAISYYIISDKYHIQLEGDNMLIYANNKRKYNLNINNINKIIYSIPEKRNSICLLIYLDINKIRIISGVFYTERKESKKFANYFEEILHDFLLNKGFTEEIKTKNKNVAYILTKKV